MKEKKCEALAALLESGVDPNTKLRPRETALSFAVAENSEDCVWILLAAGAKVDENGIRRPAIRINAHTTAAITKMINAALAELAVLAEDYQLSDSSSESSDTLSVLQSE